MRENGEKLGKNPANLLLTYFGGHLIFFAQDGGRKGSVLEPKVIQKQPLMKYATVATDVFGLYM